MSYELKIKNKNNYLNATVQGQRNTESIKNVTKEICEMCIKNQHSKVLIDVRNFKEHIAVNEIRSLASIELPDIIKKKIKKVAIIDEKGSEDNQRCFENVARNLGHNVRIFTNINDAEQWLLQKSLFLSVPH